MADEMNETRGSISPDAATPRRNPDDLPRADQPPAKTAADSITRPDGANDLYDDSLPRDNGTRRAATPPALDSTAPSRQSDCAELIPNPPVDHHDPFSSTPSIHPVGTSVGAASGAAAGVAAGFAIGSTLGPVGAAVGAAAGGIVAAFAGAAAGRQVAESINPSTEDHYWRAVYPTRSYAKKGVPYDDYRPAYLFGGRTRLEFPTQTWSQVEPELQARWEKLPEAAKLPWSLACPAVHDAWDKLTPRDPDL